jgi:hypothetical protein
VDDRIKHEGGGLIFKYLSTLLTDKEPVISELHSSLIIAGMASSIESETYAKYKELMLRFVKTLLMIIKEKPYRGLLADFVKKKYVPIEESCALILEAKQGTLDFFSDSLDKKKPFKSKPVRDREINESLAILCKRQGLSEKAIDLYIQVLINLSHTEVVCALYINKNCEIPFDE